MEIFNTEFFTSNIIGFLISTVIFIASYSLFNIIIKNKTIIKFLKKKKNNYIWSLLIAIFISLLTLISHIPSTALSSIGVFLIANIFIYAFTFNNLIGYFSGIFVALFNLLFYLTKQMTFFNFFNSILLIAIILVFIFISYVVAFKNNLIVFLYIFSMCLLMNLNLLIGSTDNSPSHNPLLNIGLFNVFLFLYFLLCFVLTKPFAKFIANATNINEKTYMQDKFILFKFFPQHFYEFMHTNNVTYGCLFIIDFNFNKDLISQYSASFIKSIKLKFIDSIRAGLEDQQVLYFLTKENNYAFFVKLDKIPTLDTSIAGNDLSKRLLKDTLRYYEDKFRELPLELIIDEKNYHKQFKFRAAYYGVQDNDIDLLIEGCENFNPQKSHNLILLYDPLEKDYNQEITNKKNKILVKENFFNNNEIKMKDNVVQINQQKYLYCTPFIVEKLIFTWDEFLSLSTSYPIQDAIISHLSAIALKNYHHSKIPLLINYHQYTLINHSFDVEKFIHKIKNDYHVENFAINIIIYDEHINKTLIDNIQKLKSYKIKCFINCSSKDLDTHNLQEIFNLKSIKQWKGPTDALTPGFVIS